jgi:6-hydroxynicotinate 3-monooxygenase
MRIAVVGALLGGLTAAGFLQSGFPTVYEQASAFSRVGAPIILSANMVMVLRRLGIEDDLVASGIRPHGSSARAWDAPEGVAAGTRLLTRFDPPRALGTTRSR